MNNTKEPEEHRADASQMWGLYFNGPGREQVVSSRVLKLSRAGNPTGFSCGTGFELLHPGELLNPGTK